MEMISPRDSEISSLTILDLVLSHPSLNNIDRKNRVLSTDGIVFVNQKKRKLSEEECRPTQYNTCKKVFRHELRRLYTLIRDSTRKDGKIWFSENFLSERLGTRKFVCAKFAGFEFRKILKEIFKNFEFYSEESERMWIKCYVRTTETEMRVTVCPDACSLSTKDCESIFLSIRNSCKEFMESCGYSDFGVTVQNEKKN